nr:unnamed protein product [Gossypium raimondii]
MENTDYHCGVDVKDLSLVPDLVLPPKFKMPEFEKYNGTSCPEAHITMFCRRMTGYVNNDQLLIHCFQDSLIGSAAKWYNQLSRANIHSWKDLARAFMKQYNHVTDMTPDRITLQNMEKKQSESFRQYAQRWREVATQVQPPLLEKETTMLFINTLKAPFINHMLGSATMSFSDMVMSGEMIENAIRSGKIDARESAKRSTPKHKENEVSNLSLCNKGYSKAVTEGQPRVVTTGYQDTLRFINMGIVKFDDPSGPNVAGNPLPSHPDPRVNAIAENGGKRAKTNVAEVKTPLKWVLKQMIDVGLTIQNLEKRPKGMRSYCEFHAKEGHEIQECADFKALVQSLMDNKKLEFFEEDKARKGCGKIRTLTLHPKRELMKRIYEASPDIKGMSYTAIDSKSSFEQDMCPDEPQDFEDDRDCSSSPDLLMMVE